MSAKFLFSTVLATLSTYGAMGGFPKVYPPFAAACAVLFGLLAIWDAINAKRIKEDE